MSTPDDDKALKQELDVLMSKAGATIPDDRNAGVLAGYRELKAMAAMLRQPRTVAAEPSNIYSLKTFIGRK